MPTNESGEAHTLTARLLTSAAPSQAGRTTLGGEGLQRLDGSSHLMAATIPNCKSCEPAFAAELAWIVDAGIREMMEEQHDVFYYVTLLNESYPQPAIAATHREGALRGAYLFEPNEMQDATQRVTLLGSGVILTEVVKAAASLRALGIGV